MILFGSGMGVVIEAWKVKSCQRVVCSWMVLSEFFLDHKSC